MEKSVQAGEGLSPISRNGASRRGSSGCAIPPNHGCRNAPVEWIEVSYPGADIGVFGIGMHWLVWFCIVNLITMLALRKRFGVTF